MYFINHKISRNEIISLATTIFLFFSLGAALYLSQRPQDIRKRAAESLTHRGKTITKATLSVYSAQNTTSVIRLKLYAQKTGACNQFSSTPYDLSKRPLTSNRIQWVPSKWTLGLKINSPNIASAIQEVVSRNDFTGSSLCTLIKEDGSDRWTERTVFSYEGNSTLSPYLHISYY